MICSKCKKDLPEDQFYNNRQNKRGRTYYCRKCSHIARMEIRARKVIKAMKIYGLCCADCRTTDIMVLQFHHVKGGGSEENIRKVAEKINKAGKVLPDYVLVCANCHIHRDYKDKTRKHNVFLRDYYLLNRPPSSLS